MFDEELVKKSKALEERWQRHVEERYRGADFKATTASGIPVKPMYSAADVADKDYEDIGVPGEYPYTRGVYPLHYQFQPWMNQLVHGYGLPEQTRERMDLLSREGMRGYFGGGVHNLVYDLVSQGGYDPDHPEAWGRVGQCGVSVATVKDMELLFHGLPLDKSNVVHIIGEPTMAILAMFIVAGERMGYAKDKLRGNTMNYLFRQWHWDTVGFPPENSFKLMVQLVKYCTREMPQWNTTNFAGYNMEEAGATAVQELAFTLGTAVALTEECVKAGLNPDDFLPRFGFQIAQGNDFFEQIAKLRALRRMWAKINKERFGCNNPKSMQARVHTHTAGCTLTAQQPLNNIVRSAMQTLGAVLGGTNAIETASYDEAFSIPTEEAATLALRTQQIILHETKIPDVSDPLAGSYYLEWLTDRIEEEAYKLMQKIDDLGGYIQCWRSGWLKGEVIRSAHHWRESVNSGVEKVVGLNIYESGEQERIPVFKTDPEVERVAIERVRKYREERDSTKTQGALAAVREEALKARQGEGGEGELMPALIEAARADATLGEMMDVLKNVFDWGYAY